MSQHDERVADHESYIRRCIELARHAAAGGDVPVGSWIAGGDGAE